MQANADQVTLTERPSTPATLLSFHSFGTSEQIRFQAVPGKQLHANQWRFFALSQEVEFFRGAIRASRAMPPWNATMECHHERKKGIAPGRTRTDKPKTGLPRRMRHRSRSFVESAKRPAPPPRGSRPVNISESMARRGLRESWSLWERESRACGAPHRLLTRGRPSRARTRGARPCGGSSRPRGRRRRARRAAAGSA